MKDVLFNGHDVVLLMTIYLCISFAIFLFFMSKENNRSNVLLALFLFSQAAIPLDILINFGEDFRAYAITYIPNAFYVFGTAYWFDAPLLLLYLRTLIYKDYVFSKRDLFLFLPAVVYIIYEIDGWYLLEHDTKIAILNGYSLAEESAYRRFIHLFRESFRFVCGVLCVLELNKYHNRIKNEFSNLENRDLTWLKILIVGFLLIYLDAIFVALALISSSVFSLGVDHELFGLASNYAVLLLVSYLIFSSVKYSGVFTGINSNNSNNKNVVEDTPIDHEQIVIIENYMQSRKPFLNPLLNIENLATQLQLPQRKLSLIINRHFNQNFFEYINNYRIDESKRLLKDSDYLKATMLEIMDKSGFNSKATFNVFFKKTVGLTPTEYRKKNIK